MGPRPCRWCVSHHRLRAHLAFRRTPLVHPDEPLFFFAATLFDAKALQLRKSTNLDLCKSTTVAHSMQTGPRRTVRNECARNHASRAAFPPHRAVDLTLRLRPAFCE